VLTSEHRDISPDSADEAIRLHPGRLWRAVIVLTLGGLYLGFVAGARDIDRYPWILALAVGVLGLMVGQLVALNLLPQWLRRVGTTLPWVAMGCGLVIMVIHGFF